MCCVDQLNSPPLLPTVNATTRRIEYRPGQLQPLQQRTGYRGTGGGNSGCQTDFGSPTSNDSVYKEVLLDHFHNPRNRGELDGMDVVRRGSNPRCGDEIEVGIACDNGALSEVRFRGRGCSICLASASMMTECTSGLKFQQARQLTAILQLWFGDRNSEGPANETLSALGAIRQHPARKKCVLLAWQALDEALDGIEARSEVKNT